MVKTETKTIDGHEITVTQYTAREGLAIFTKLGKLLSPALNELYKVDDLTKIDTEGAGNILPALSVVLNGLSETEFTPFILRILRSTFIDKKNVTEEIFDMEFAGKYTLLFKVVGFALEVNFKDFFGAGGIGSLRQPRPESPTV